MQTLVSPPTQALGPEVDIGVNPSSAVQQRIRVVDPVQRVRRETGRTDGVLDFLRVGRDGPKRR